jgi:hypothetical protein
MIATPTDAPDFETLEVSLKCSVCGFNAGWKTNVWDGVEMGDDELGHTIAAQRIRHLWELAQLHNQAPGHAVRIKQKSHAFVTGS